MKKQISLLLSFLFLFTLVLPAFAAGESGPVLAANGATDYRIVLSSSAEPAERTAADTLADYLQRVTGAVFPVVTDAEPAAEKELVVGVTNREAARFAERDQWDADAVCLLTDGQTLFLTGGSARGTLYAVYTFLEDHLGCRWFTHDLTVVPQRDTLPLPTVDYFYEPGFRLRQTFWAFSAIYPDFCAAHKLHGVMAGLPEELGGGRYELAISSVHTMQQIVPQALFDEHPDYFGADETGARSPNRQPCLRNDGVFRLALAYAENYFSQYNAILSVSQNDSMDFCRCEKCRAFNAAHGGVDSAALLDFVNRLAAAIQQTHPAAQLETLAYQRSQQPPVGLTVGDNVVIRLCAMNTCTLHELDDPTCPPNKAFDADFSGWSKLTDRLYIWDYSTDFQYYYALFPNLTTLQGRYRYFRDHHVIGVFDNGCGELTVPGEFHELRTYLLLKILWDPDADVKQHLREFCAAYYGAAAEDVIVFIRRFEASAGGFNPRTFRTCHNSCQDGGISLLNNVSLSKSDVKKLDRLMASAKSKSLSADQAKHLQGLELSWRFFKNALFVGEFNWFSGFTDPAAATLRLVDDLRDYGVTCLSEGWGLILKDEAPDARMMPTFWYADEGSLPPDLRLELKARVLIHTVLYAVLTPLRWIMNGGN